jgi:hypothetical protein
MTMPRHARYVFVTRLCTPAHVVISDIGPHDRHATVTNDAEQVIFELWSNSHLDFGRRVYYYDSLNRLDELEHDDEGHFTGFRGCSARERQRIEHPKKAHSDS